MADTSTLTERVRTIREARGLTQAQLAAKARMERTDINKLERGKLALGPGRLARVAAALEVSVIELAPEAAPDDRGFALDDRLAQVEAQVAELTEVLRLSGESQDALRGRVEELEGRLRRGRGRRGVSTRGGADSE